MRRLLGRLEPPGPAALVLLAVWVTWSWVAAVLAGRTPSLTSPYVLSPIVLVVGVVVGRLLVERVPPGVVTAGLALATALLLLGVLTTAGPAKAPLGYANANAALCVQLVALCGLALLRPGAGRAHRVLLALTAVAGVAAIVANASRAAAVVVLPLLAAVALMAWRPARRTGWAVALGAVSVVAGATAVVLLAGLEQWPPWALTALDSARQSLWRDALALWSTHPLTGGGPGSLPEFSTLGSDPDTASAHSSLLQVGAETGWVGVVLLSLVVVTGLRWAARGRAPDAVVAVAAWTALVLHSLTDHLLEFGWVVLAAGLVLGWAGATRSEQLDVAEGEGPVPW